MRHILVMTCENIGMDAFLHLTVRVPVLKELGRIGFGAGEVWWSESRWNRDGLLSWYMVQGSRHCGHFVGVHFKSLWKERVCAEDVKVYWSKAHIPSLEWNQNSRDCLHMLNKWRKGNNVSFKGPRSLGMMNAWVLLVVFTPRYTSIIEVSLSGLDCLFSFL